MKIVTFSNYFPEHVGGIEFVALNLVKQWRISHQVRWVACDIKAHPHIIKDDDVPLPSSNFTEEYLGFPYPVPIGRSVATIFKQVKWSDVVHINDCLYLANLFAFIASRWYRKPLLVTQHAALASYPESYKRFLQWIAYRTIGKMVLKNAEKIIFISSRVKDWFESWVDFKVQTLFIPNGVDHQLFFPPIIGERAKIRSRFGYLPDQLVLLFVGRFMQNKGVRYVYKVAQSRPNYHWLMLGNGEIDPSAWNLPNVNMLPPQRQTELRQFYISADLFVLPSVGEGFPLTVQEALSCGLPVAVSYETATYLPDAPFIKLDVYDTTKMLNTLDEVLLAKNKLSPLRNQSVKYSQRWDWKNVASQYEEVLENLVNLEGV